MKPSSPSLAIKPGSWLDFNAVNSRRAFALMAIGAVIGLILAGAALFKAKGTTTLIVPADAVAMVNQQPISRIDYAAQLTALGLDPNTATPAERRKVLEDLIREELYVQRAKELDVAVVDPEVRGAMVKAIEAQAAANVLTSTPTEKELRGYYEAHRAKYASEGTMTAADLVFPAATAEAAHAALARGEAPAAVMARLGGRDSGRIKDEEFYFAARIHLGESMFARAAALPDGGVSAPEVMPDGVHMVVMVRNRRPKPYSYEEARIQVLTDSQSEATARYEAADGRFLRKRANVLIAPDLR